MPFHTTDDGCRLAYSLEGRTYAPTLLLSNSLGTTRGMWNSQMDALASRFRVLRYDTRGHGESDAPAGDYSIERLGRDAVSLIDAAGIDRAHVCGVSLGGLTALWLGLNARDRVHRLVLANTAAKIGNDDSWNDRMRSVSNDGLGSIADSVMERWFTASFRQTSPETVERIREAFLRTPTAGYLGACAALRDADLREATSTMRPRCLVITGAQDPATPPELGEWLARTIAGARMVSLDAAHLSNIEQPALFNDAVVRHLND